MIRTLALALFVTGTAISVAESTEVFPRSLACPNFGDGFNFRSNFRTSMAVFVATVTTTELTSTYEVKSGVSAQRYVNVHYDLKETFKGNAPQTGVILTKTMVGGMCVFPTVSGQDYVFFIHEHNGLVPAELRSTSLGEINVFGSLLLPHDLSRSAILAPFREFKNRN
jgi:hypothetical protein